MTFCTFSTKKKPALAGDDGGRIMPAFNEDWMYSFMAKVSGGDSENNLPLGRDVPGSKSMV